MRDPRIRLLATLVLSVASFVSIWAAVLVFLWWLVFSEKRKTFRNRISVAVLFGTVALAALATGLTGGPGLSYFIRLGVIALVALWVYNEWSPGEAVKVSVWLFGSRAGFDLGLVAEMSMQALNQAGEDLERSRIAMRFKGGNIRGKAILSVASQLLSLQIMRIHNQADLLAIRGYRKGGMLCPEFITPPRDLLAGSLAIIIGFFTFIPVRDIFILIQ